MTASEMSFVTYSDGQRLGLRVSGELDLTSAPRLAGRLVQLVRSGEAPRVEVDLAEVTFMDSTGLAALVNAHREATAASVELVVVSPSPQVRRLLTTSRLDDFIATVD